MQFTDGKPPARATWTVWPMSEATPSGLIPPPNTDSHSPWRSPRHTCTTRVGFIDHGVYLKQQNHYKLIGNNNLKLIMLF